MIIIAAADLHCAGNNHKRLEAVARAACQADGEVLLVAGDVVSGCSVAVADVLGLFADFKGPRLFVPGNHDLWQAPGSGNTWARYQQELPAAAAAAGFQTLDFEPFLYHGYAFIGCLGWYDYSMRQVEPPQVDIRVTPVRPEGPEGPFHASGARKQLRWEELTVKDYHLGAVQWQNDSVLQAVVWNDQFYVNWGRNDEEMATYFAERLQEQVDALGSHSNGVIVVTHFVPLAEMLPRAQTVPTAYARAFAGSVRLGEVIRGIPKVKLAVFGHWHEQRVRRLKGLSVANVSVDHGRQGPLRLEF